MQLKSLLVIVALAFVTSETAQAAQPTDACSLLTPAQISAVLGVSVGTGEKLAPNSASICGWQVPGERNFDRKRVVLSIYTQLGSMSPTQRFNNAKTPIPGISKEPVSGVGDDAVFATTPGVGTGLIFRKGDGAFDLRVYGFSPDQVKTKEQALAQNIIAKL